MVWYVSMQMMVVSQLNMSSASHSELSAPMPSPVEPKLVAMSGVSHMGLRNGAFPSQQGGARRER
jgi:hypothetical protein